MTKYFAMHAAVRRPPYASFAHKKLEETLPTELLNFPAPVIGQANQLLADAKVKVPEGLREHRAFVQKVRKASPKKLRTQNVDAVFLCLEKVAKSHGDAHIPEAIDAIKTFLGAKPTSKKAAYLLAMLAALMERRWLLGSVSEGEDLPLSESFDNDAELEDTFERVMRSAKTPDHDV